MLLENEADPAGEAEGGRNARFAAGGGAITDVSGGPPLGTCFPATSEALLEAADRELKPGMVTPAAPQWLAPLGECDEILSRLPVGG